MVALPKPKPVEEPVAINTHGMVCDFGKHRGELYTRLPVSYLQWMINQEHSRADVARAELKRRNTQTPTLDVSGHAIDGASTRCRHIWDETRMTGEGIYSWLCRTSKDALENAEADPSSIDDQGRVHFRGMIFAFEREGEWPVLKTIFPEKRSTRVDWAAPVQRRLDRMKVGAKAYGQSKGNW